MLWSGVYSGKLKRSPDEEAATDTSPEKHQHDPEPEPLSGENIILTPEESQPLQIASDQPATLDIVRNQTDTRHHETAKKKRGSSPALAPQAKKTEKSKKGRKKSIDIGQDECTEPMKPELKGHKGSLIVQSTTADERMLLDPNYLCGLFRLEDGRVYLFNAGVEKPTSEPSLYVEIEETRNSRSDNNICLRDKFSITRIAPQV